MSSRSSRVKFRQYRLLPSGCMSRKGFSSLHVVGGDIHGKYFAFCSTLAVYVYRIDTFQLHRLFSTAENLAGLVWCQLPQYGNWLVTVSLSRKAVLYDVDTEQILYETKLPPLLLPNAFQWNPTTTQLIVASSTIDGNENKTPKVPISSALFAWTIDHPNRSHAITTAIKTIESQVTVLRYNSAGILAIGFENGNLAIFDGRSEQLRILDKKKKSKKNPNQHNGIIDLQWDTLSTIYLLVATRDGHCALWEVTETTGAPLHTFDKQGAGTTAIAWLPWASGLFVTTNARTGNLKLWNVSQTAPLEHMRVRQAGVGILGLTLLPTQHVICASTDGSVAMYHVPKKQLSWQSNPGHKETIFDIRWQPGSADVIATCGHDGTVRVWNIQSMECTHHLHGQDGIAYSIAWSPTSSTQIASASALGTVYIWDLKQQTPTVQMKPHTDAIYCVAWCKSMLASTSKDKTVAISRGDGTLVKRYLLPNAAYGCDWNPVNHILAVGCGDNLVRLFDVDSSSQQPIRILVGHEARVFHTAWYPYQTLHRFLASSSDDCTVRVWTIPSEPDGVVAYVTLKGHTNHVRALAWSHNRNESPLLLSGSWDSTIRLWDVMARECRLVVSDHIADVYGIATHVQTPCLFVSCSRDTTIRFWGLSTPATRLRLLESIVTPPWNDDKIHELMIETCTASGISNLLALLVRKGNTLGTELMVIPLADKLLAVTMERARKLECGHNRRAKPTKLNHADQLRQSAFLYLKAGCIKHYCRLMVELDDWEAALAMAPAVSMEYWHELAASYATELATQQSECAFAYYAVTNQVEKAVDTFQSRGQLTDACVIAKANVDGLFPSYTPQHTDVVESHDDKTSTKLLLTTYKGLADVYSDRGEPILAACCHLAVGQIQSAIDRLIRGDCIELAWILSHLHQAEIPREITLQLINRCEILGAAQLAIEFASSLDSHEMALVYIRQQHSEELKVAAGIEEKEVLEDKLQRYLQSDSNVVDALMAYLLLGRVHDAVNMVLTVLQGLDLIVHDFSINLEELTEKEETWPLFLSLTHIIRSIEIVSFDSKNRARVLALMAFGGCIQAMKMRYPLDLVSYLMHIIHAQRHNYGISFPISEAMLFYMEAKYASRLDRDKALVLLKQLDHSNDTLTSNLQEEVVALHRQLKQEPPDLWLETNSLEAVIVSGSRLPSSGQTRTPVLSLLTGDVIHGPFVRLEDDVSALTLEEAIMWHRVNPFSPLSTGEKINMD